MSEKWFTHASPTMFNAGTNTPQMSSCFLLTMARRRRTAPHPTTRPRPVPLAGPVTPPDRVQL
jgi:hypothetical protein